MDSDRPEPAVVDTAIDDGDVDRIVGAPSAHDDLAPAARRLLEAGRQVFERNGLAGLTMEAVAREAGDPRSLIWYYFGGKPGFLAVLADWVYHESLADLRRRIDAMSPGPERQKLAMANTRQMLADTESFQVSYTIFPYAIGNRNARRRMAKHYAAYRALNAEALSPTEEPGEDADALAAMLVALTDGLAAQLILDPGCLNLSRIMKIWDTLVQHVLGDESGGEAVEEGDPSS